MNPLKDSLRQMSSRLGQDPADLDDAQDPGNDDEGEPYVINNNLAADRSVYGMSAEQQRKWLKRYTSTVPSLPSKEWQPK